MSRVYQKRKQFLRFVPIVSLTVAVFLAVGFVTSSDNDLFLKIYRGIDTFGKIYKEIAMNYVDEIDPDKFMRAGIDGMLRTLDPYTVYIDESENHEIDLVTTGKYGGVGITVGLRDGMITVVNLLEGFSASKQGIQVGDRIVEIDGRSMKDVSFDIVRSLVRGAPGTEIRMKVEREGEEKLLEFVLLREEIPVKNVTYAGFVEPGIGYIKLERFSRTAGDDIRTAIKDLKESGGLKGLVLDLRNNPGGLLDMAVDVASKFVPESSLVVTTRGRRSDAERSYYTAEKPMLADVPLAVLVDRGSASASEIVAGAIQDLDRGIIVGARTFGKGLVQTITRLSERTSLKITTGRYFTPSGRSIQEVDYFHRSKDGSVTVIADSLRREFRTSQNRRVYEAGGIRPDSSVDAGEPSPFLVQLNRKAIPFKFANRFASKNKSLSEDFRVTDEILAEFEEFLREREFQYEDELEGKLAEIRQSAEAAKYPSKLFEQLDQLGTTIRKENLRVFQRHKEEVRRVLLDEIFGRVHGSQFRIRSSFGHDRQLQVAVSLLRGTTRYEQILSGKTD